jgi:serine/threonine protein kinase
VTPSLPVPETGGLGEEGVTGLLQDFEQRRVSGIVLLHTDAGDAEVEFLSGTIIDARMEQLSGRGALFRLLGLTSGSYELRPERIAPRPALTPSLDRVLGELSQWHKLSEQAPALSSVPELSQTGRDALERRSLADEQRMLLELVDGQRALAEIIDESGVDAVDALTLLVGAVQGSLISIRSAQASLYPLKSAFGVVAPIVPISAGAPASAPAPSSPNAAPTAYIPVGRKTLMTSSPPLGAHAADAPAANTAAASEAARPVPGVHRIISIDSPSPAAPNAAPRVTTASFEPAEPPATARHFGAQPEAAPSESGPRRSSPYPPPSVGEMLAAPEPQRAIEPQGDARYIGRYQVLCRIGRGGMGSVYLCRLSSQGGFRRLFALKLLRKHLLADSAAAHRFLEEARLSGHIHHPNVVSVVDAGLHASQPYLVMDYVEGGSFKDLLAANANVRQPQLILPIIIDALSGLHCAHTLVADDGTPLSIVHCDVSPENLLVGVDGVCRLTDFGVARHGSAANDPGTVTHGKPGYLAPEQIANGRVDCRADVFALGVVLYKALSGVKLFEGATVEETLYAVRRRRVEPPSTVGLRPPPSLDFVCMRALERDPDRRFASAQEMMIELRRIALRENLLAPTSDVAAWVRESVGHDLTRRRLIILEASKRLQLAGSARTVGSVPAALAGTGAPVATRLAGSAPAISSGPPERSEPPLSSSMPAPPNSSSHNTRTIALDTSLIAGSGAQQASRWALIGASVIAAIAVLVTLLWPGLVSKVFRIRTEAVTEDTHLRSVGTGDVPVPPQTASEKAPPAPSR